MNYKKVLYYEGVIQDLGIPIAPPNEELLQAFVIRPQIRKPFYIPYTLFAIQREPSFAFPFKIIDWTKIQKTTGSYTKQSKPSGSWTKIPKPGTTY